MKIINILTFLFSLACLILLIILNSKDRTGASLVPVNPSTKMSVPLSPIKMQIPKEISEDTAFAMTNAYRNNISDRQTRLIAIDSNDLMNYIEDNFKAYTAKITPPKGFRWAMGLNPMYFQHEGENKMTIAFIPALIEKSKPKNIIDYWTSKAANDSFYQNYFSKLFELSREAGFKSIILDEGHLWP